MQSKLMWFSLRLLLLLFRIWPLFRLFRLPYSLTIYGFIWILSFSLICIWNYCHDYFGAFCFVCCFFLHFHFGRTKYRLNGFIVSIWKITKNLNGFIVTAQRERDRHGESILFSIACWQLVFHSFQNVKWFYLFQLNAERFITGKINAILTQKHRVCVCFA